MRRLKRSFITVLYLSFISPVSSRSFGECEHDIALHLSSSIVISVDQLLYEVTGEGNEEGIADDSQLGQHLHDLEPDPNVLSSLCHSSPCLTHKLLSIQSDLHPVVEESKERSQGEGSYKDGDETKLQN